MGGPGEGWGAGGEQAWGCDLTRGARSEEGQAVVNTESGGKGRPRRSEGGPSHKPPHLMVDVGASL